MADDETGTGASSAGGDEGRPLAARVDTIEAEQQRQGGILEQIRDHLTGTDHPSQPDNVTRADTPAASAAEMAEQMRQAVRDVNAEAAAASTAQPARPEPETTPREVMVRGKDKLQRVLFGGDPKK